MDSNQIMATIIKAANFAADRHRSQTRRDGTTPYVNHCVGVAYILTNEAKVFDAPTLTAALLHDTVEDTPTTFDELEAEFGAEVCALVRECTDDARLSRAEQKQQQIEHAATLSHKAKLIKLADKLYNVRDGERSADLARAKSYVEWAKKVVDQMRGTNDALERALDECFRKQLS